MDINSYSIKEIVDKVISKQDEIVLELRSTREALITGLNDISNFKEEQTKQGDAIHELQIRVRRVENKDREDTRGKRAKATLYTKLAGVASAAASLIYLLIEQIK